MSVVIPTWNGAALLRVCLRTLETQTFHDFETIVVDNGSRDGTVEMLKAEFPTVRCVALSQNRGFAAATNLGLAAAGGEILVCLNNDVECESSWLAALVSALDRMPDVGSVASKMMDAKRPGVIDSAGDAMSLRAWNVGRGELDRPEFNVGREILSACAGAAAYRRAIFDAVGWFDERYFAWFEDVDLGLRAQFAGFGCWYEPSAVVRHHGSATSAIWSEPKAFLTMRNGLRLFFKTMPLRRLVPWGVFVLLWPLFDPLVFGRPLRVTLRAWLAFWLMFPEVLRARREVYARRCVPIAHVTRLLASPWDDVRWALAAARQRLGNLFARSEAS